jgi:LysM repeat protein
MKCLIFILIGVAGSNVVAQIDPMTVTYIDQHRELARAEMARSGIPASITLAQGILESRSGQSRLATDGNNHFGIKCHEQWTGKTIHEDDDSRHECFRKYGTVEESYRDHSDFLMTRERYKQLFEIPKEDYTSWAYGLKSAGYATSPTYAQSLIGLIQRYELYRYDLDDLPMVAVADPVESSQQPPAGCPYATHVFLINRIKTVFMQPRQTIADIAEEHDSREVWLQEYNEVSASNRIEPGMHVFLQPKRNKAEVKYHRVGEGETMYAISQRYGIRLSELYRKNLMSEGQEPADGETIYMRAQRKDRPALRQPAITPSANEDRLVEQTERVQQPVVEVQTVSPENELEADLVPNPASPTPESDGFEAIFEARHVFTGVADTSEVVEVNPLDESGTAVNEAVPPQPIAASTQAVYRHHTVEQFDTLYGLSRKYAVNVDQLRTWNGLQDDTIKIGQALIVGIE